MNNSLKSLENPLQNNALAALIQRAPQGITKAVQNASAKTGVSFAYLMEKAAAESSFNPAAKAKTSSATGLFQFIESTWMDMVKKHGAKHGINPNQPRSELLELRKNPDIASLMAAEFAKGNKDHLTRHVGGSIGNTELYFAHFMGAGGASAFLNQMKANPNAIAADLFPEAARANRTIFYDSRSGTPRTLQSVYDHFDKKFSAEQGRETAVAHASKPNNLKQRAGYTHIPPSLQQPVEIHDRAANTLYQLRNEMQQMDAFFALNSPSPRNDFALPSGKALSGSTSFFLNLLTN